MKFDGKVEYGQKAEADRKKIIRDLKHGCVRPVTYVITRSDENGRIEMFHNATFLRYPERGKDRTVIGIAEGRSEGLDVIRIIVARSYGTETD